jgi:mRNA-degrading endonuclease RelE of RelBE toxin-antitoxin system
MGRQKRIIWTDRARAELRAIDRETALHILHALTRLIASGEGDVKQLQAREPPQYRFRVGDHRVLFRYLEDGIQIVAVKHRREAYR